MSFIAVPLLAATTLLASFTSRTADQRDWAIRDGRFYDRGEWVFLKIGKPLINFGDPAAVEGLRSALGILQEKNYNALELNCYWHHLDHDGDGRIDVSLEPLRGLIDAIYERGMYPCLSVETYGVGGGNIPADFWRRHPDAVAINAKGEKVADTEYGFGSGVPSLFSPDYLRASRAFIRELVAGLPHQRILYYETTVEPQYIGNQNLDYTPHARLAFEAWLDDNGMNGPAWPESFPVPESFQKDPVWNRFRAEALAAWIDADAAVIRSVAGSDAYIAVDYLETGGREMVNRNGDSMVFLRSLTCADIVQVNWHWHLRTRAPNQVAYDNVHTVMRQTGRDWVVTEHMTLNGSDYPPEEVEPMLENTLNQGTRFGWEFVSVTPSSGGAFAMYHDDWSAKPLIAEVDENWDAWMERVRSQD